MDPTDLSDDQLDQLAAQLAGRLPTGTHGDNVVLSRRQFALAASGVLSAGALMALGVDEASAQAAAGQVGTPSSPVDAFVYNLDVQNGAEFNGTDLSGVGSVSTEQVNSNYKFAEAFDGNNQERRLDNALSDASEGDTIYLESVPYFEDRTISKRITIKSGRSGPGTALSGTWTLANRLTIEGLLLTAGTDTGQFQVNADRCTIENIELRGKITVDGSDCVLSKIIAPFGDAVDFTANATGCIIDSSTGVTVTGNTTDNEVGDIA